MISFTEIPLSASLQRRLVAAEFLIPTPIQAASIPHALDGKDLVATAPTGTGKTFAAFLAVLNELALLHEGEALRDTIYAIYASPLRALSRRSPETTSPTASAVDPRAGRDYSRGGQPRKSAPHEPAQPAALPSSAWCSGRRCQPVAFLRCGGPVPTGHA